MTPIDPNMKLTDFSALLKRLPARVALLAMTMRGTHERIAVLVPRAGGRCVLCHATVMLDSSAWPVICWDEDGGGWCRDVADAVRRAEAPAAIVRGEYADGERVREADCIAIREALERAVAARWPARTRKIVPILPRSSAREPA